MSDGTSQAIASEAILATSAEQSGSPDPPPLNRERRARLDALYRDHWAELVAYVRRSFGSGPPDPEDAVQGAFTQFAALPDPEAVHAPRAFLYRLATNFVLDFKRKARVRFRFAAGAEAEFLFGGREEVTPERVLDAKQRVERLNAVLQKLKPAYREAALLNRVHGMTVADIARKLGISESEARRRVQKALNACTAAMAEIEGEPTSKGERP